MRSIIKKIKSLFTKGVSANNSLSKDYIKSLIKSDKPIILEIGCANGDDTLDFIKVFSDTDFRLYGFEPEPKNIKIIEEKVHSNRFELFKGVMSDTDGELTFNRSRTDNPDDLSFSGSIMKPKNHLKMWDWIYFDQSIVVPSITLDTFCKSKNINIIDFIWCDVQGAEEKLILGGIETFEKKVRYLFTEYSNDEQYEGQPTLEKILKILPSFEIIKNDGADVLLKNKNL
jgi:FkbM family methyltransferase